MRDKLAEAEKEKREGQAMLGKKGRREERCEEERKLEIAERDRSQQAVRKLMALAEKKDGQRMEERRTEQRRQGVRLTRGQRKNQTG